METDLYAGAQAKFGDVSVRARYLRLVFHDAENIDFDQFEIGLSAPVGPLNWGVGSVHDEYNGGGHSTYVYTSAAYPISDTGITVKGLVGYEDGTGWDDKVNWSLGASYSTGPFVIGVDYIDTNKFSPTSDGDNRAGATAVFYVGGRF
jgi:predicted porin